MKEKVKIAVFDVCWTIYPANTTVEFLEFVYGKDSLRMRLYRFLAKLSILLRVSSVYDKYRAFPLKGKKVSELRELSGIFAKSHLSNIAHGRILTEMEELRKSGFEIVLISASIDPVIDAIADYFWAKRFSSRLEIREGRYTGLFAEDYLELGKKSQALTKIFDSGVTIDWTNSVCYSDSQRDLEEWKTIRTKHLVNEAFVKW